MSQMHADIYLKPAYTCAKVLLFSPVSHIVCILNETGDKM